MSALSDLYPEIIPQASGVPEPVADIHIRNAVIEFCEQSLAYQADIAEIPLVQGQGTYTVGPLPNPTHERVAMVISIRHNETPITPQTRSHLDSHSRNWRSNTGNLVRFFHDSGLNGVRVVPLPDADAVTFGGLNIRVALVPTMGATQFSADLFERYHEILANGALSRIMSMVGKPWYDRVMAVNHRALFHEGIASARVDRIKDGTDISMSAAYGEPFA